ncbi:multifunctional conjugation protein TraI [Caedimonas varicaedens]|uniref:Multifunctional conjugation protein TraI n=1 Tax=Caedimonas varicaedens TaxID=1629334 RepID=A0A0K8MA65_9PROT|nr:multifunctional conjugation protein TraI [Caedimonas varicaedens]
MGYAGAGKSAILEAAKEAWEASGYRVYGLSPFGKAAENLQKKGIPSQTLHKFLKSYHNGRSHYHVKSVLVLDEAGSVDVTRFQEFLAAVEHLGVKAVVVGDGAQTQPIEAGAAFRLVTSRMGLRKIETVVRQKETWQREASRLFGTYETRQALQMYQDRGHVQFVEEKIPDLQGLMAQEKHREIVECYNLSRRLCGNIYHKISEEAESKNLSSQETFVFLKKHQDYAVFKHWQTLRRSASDSILSHLEDCRPLMKELGVDPLKFAGQFVQRDRDVSSQNTQASQLVKFWNLPTPDPETLPHQCEVRAETKKEMVRQWAVSLKEFPDQSHVMLTYTNRDTASLNHEARHLMKQQRVVSLEEYVCTLRREDKDDFGRIVVTEEQKPFARGDQIVFTRNDNSLNVKNGTLGTIEEINSRKIRVKLEGEERHVSFALRLYPYFDYGWAVTIIKSQGITADRVFKLATYEENRNLAYVGMTRHHLSLKVFGSKLDFWRNDVFLDRLSSSKEKLLGLDYISQEEAARRLQPSHSKLAQALEKLGHQMDAIEFISRKGWERIAERFLGQTPRKENIQIPQESLEEAKRARLMGVHPGKISLKEKIVLKSAVLQQAGKLPPKTLTEAEMTAVFHPEPTAPVSPALSLKSGKMPHTFLSPTTPSPSPEQTTEKPQRRFAPDPQPLYRVEDVRRNLTSYSVEYLCTHLLGNSNPHLSNKRQLRYGKSGSLAITLTGKKMGMWHDFERGEGGDLFQLVQRERGGEFKEALAYVAEALRISPEHLLPRPTLSQKDDDTLKEERRRQKVQNLCNATIPLQGTLAETYLRKHRGIRGTLPADLQFIKSHYNYIAGKSFPVLAALARNKTGKVTGVQLVFLDRWTGQKAKADLTKQSVGSFIGSPVQIQKGSGVIFLAEGVETALSLKEAGLKGDIYATLSVSNIQGMGAFLQDKSRPVVICADADAENSPARKTVEEAASFLKDQGLAVSVIRPDLTKGDFNDILRKEGISAVQAYFRDYLKDGPELTSKASQPKVPTSPPSHSPYWEEEFKKQYLAAHPERATQKTITPSQSTPLTPSQIIGKFKFLTEQINTLENKSIVERLTKERNSLVAFILQDNTLMTRIRLRDNTVATHIAQIADSLKKQQERTINQKIELER